MTEHTFQTLDAAHALCNFVRDGSGDRYTVHARASGFVVVSPRGTALTACDVQDARNNGFEFPEYKGA